MSRQCDITIAEPSTPPFWDEGDYRIVPAECVYGVIEVKASLDSTELEKAWRLIADVKALPKTADFPNPPNEPQRRGTAYGQHLVDFVNHRLAIQAVMASDLDLTTSAGRQVAHHLGAAAQAESERQAERIRRQKQQAAEQGPARWLPRLRMGSDQG